MNKVQYSKIIPFITGIIFLFCLFVSFKSDIETAMDTSVYVTSITVSGGIFATSILWYLKKAASENAFKLRIELYKESAKTRIDYNKQMMILKKEYGLTNEDVYEIESESDIDEMMDSALSDATLTVDSARDEADSTIELQTL